MKHTASRLRAVLAAGGIALGLSMVAASPALAAPTTTVTMTATPEVEAGDVVDASVALAGTVDAYSYAITVTFDPALLDYVDGSASEGPAGGFDSVEEAAGSVTILHSRLGTSPALAGDLAASLQFTSLAAGDATLTTSVTLVDTVGATTVLADAATAPVTITAVPVETTPPTTTTPPTSGGDPTPTPTAAPASSSNGDGSLAITGFGAGALAVFAIAALGVGFVALRRRSAGAR
ncbi:cohesin domain-containing protein [Agreia sp. PsM10]|uniref:cohesin domain-containing protein n=1 Tax=Agreia sp. PsM10 TaxID=3030533 RepID=UPI00263A70F5|nr:cohesin domain-containing protein [Agreia sp. PsM10]MDN4642003.1 cohesin domain-containing protein [Agreia sp. PsM10]